MAIRSLWVLGFALWAAVSGYGSTINSLQVELGSWDGSTFTPDGSTWNTFVAGNWAVGATAPGYGNPVLDGFNSVNLPDGEYYLFMASNNDTAAQAIRITLGYSGSPSAVEVYTDPSGAANSGTYTLVSGSGFAASLVTGPQTAHEVVANGQNYSPNGRANWVVDVNSSVATPEPATWTLIAGAFAVCGAVRRRMLQRRF
jgi:hypothetical protein